MLVVISKEDSEVNDKYLNKTKCGTKTVNYRKKQESDYTINTIDILHVNKTL